LCWKHRTRFREQIEEKECQNNKNNILVWTKENENNIISPLFDTLFFDCCSEAVTQIDIAFDQ
jgi:hypothetical protein